MMKVKTDGKTDKTLGKYWENLGKILRKLKKVLGKPRENLRNSLLKTPRKILGES
jgi:hypothetical protein